MILKSLSKTILNSLSIRWPFQRDFIALHCIYICCRVITSYSVIVCLKCHNFLTVSILRMMYETIRNAIRSSLNMGKYMNEHETKRIKKERNESQNQPKITIPAQHINMLHFVFYIKSIHVIVYFECAVFLSFFRFDFIILVHNFVVLNFLVLIVCVCVCCFFLSQKYCMLSMFYDLNP